MYNCCFKSDVTRITTDFAHSYREMELHKVDVRMQNAMKSKCKKEKTTCLFLLQHLVPVSPEDNRFAPDLPCGGWGCGWQEG